MRYKRNLTDCELGKTSLMKYMTMHSAREALKTLRDRPHDKPLIRLFVRSGELWEQVKGGDQSLTVQKLVDAASIHVIGCKAQLTEIAQQLPVQLCVDALD